MSGADIEDRAGLYVLGALNAEEMRAVRADADREPALAAEIVAWEKRLTPLIVLIPPVAPPDSVWVQLEARLDRLAAPGQAMGEIYRPPFRQRTKRRDESRAVTYWRAAAIGAMAIAASLAGVLVTRRAPAPATFAMVMPAKPGLGGWLITMQPNGEIHAVAQGALSHTLDQDFELWALADGADRPVPLGLLSVTAGSTLKAAGLPHQKFKLLVSLEPKGGSPTGLPTGPVMFASDVVLR
jgi:anti-sigma-K factor RskA